MDTDHWSFWENWIFSDDPARLMRQWESSQILKKIPELAALQGVQQDPKWHPEGDVWIHTVLVCEQAANIAVREKLDERERSILMLAALGHDFGKPKTTELKEGRWRSPGHAKVGADICKDFLARIGCPDDIAEPIYPLICEHLAHANLKKANGKTVRRLLTRLRPANYQQLLLLVEADTSGRPPLPRGLPDYMQNFAEKAEKEIEFMNRPQPLILGEDLIKKGLQPGPRFKEILEEIYSLQLEGKLPAKADATQYLEKLLRS